MQPAPTRAAIGLKAPALAGILLLQLALLTLGIHRDYQLKHEDNNALHATFARSHLQLGLDTTRGQNYFYSPAAGAGSFYPNHPPGPGLVLALGYWLTGHDGPVVTRAIAILFHVAATWLFHGLARRVLRRRWEVLVAMLVFVVLPESAFFGRMLNHEVLVLPAAVLLVRAYWESIHGTWSTRRWSAAMVGSAIWAALSGWAGFFSLAACALHAAWEVFRRRNHRAAYPLAVVSVSGAALFALTIWHLLWILDGDAGYLRSLLASRSTGRDLEFGHWIGRILELHWRYFGLTSAVALAALAYRAVRPGAGSLRDPGHEVGIIFLIGGAGYVVAFAFNATMHDYWQFLLLPASALGVPLLMRYPAAMLRSSRRTLARAVLALAIFDVTLVITVTMLQRHLKSEGYALRIVQELRRNHL